MTSVDEYSALLVKETWVRCPPIIPFSQGTPSNERREIKARVADYRVSLNELIDRRDKKGIGELIGNNEDLFVDIYSEVSNLTDKEMDFILSNHH